MKTKRVPLVESQRWKLRLAFAMALFSGSLMWFDHQIAAWLGVSQYLPTLVGTLLGFATLAIAVVTVRCPACGTSLVWFALSQKQVGGWLPWLLDETTCPKCGHSSSDAAGPSK
jgi:hypothetical protein